ncbi:methyltransferase, cyclopropane fatty acid synthase [Spongiibacter sp. IMCC21906]|jgi:cyclopropane-fatty-acyl-phospholipid synthase|uniref:SAM-dependent methyltransferase n=1 Tax=Spongiibacter sp. IMCC21906 TaxID=1620392 RepID=UPI00062DEE7B|nr:cyclopropane-fatty-acyl-phospholipid synthase family protein [Spongiibacter sp. IMCC21906]AKH68283.1 methyltransferase, cyclopropane fatty acid synthase [Spongiibacter sp. IMCC21906]
MKSATASLGVNMGSSWWAKRQAQILTTVLSPLANARRGILELQLPNGNKLFFGDQPCEELSPIIQLNSWKALKKALSGGSVGWAEAYVAGDWDCPSLTTLIDWVVENERHISGALDSGRFSQWMQKRRHRSKANSKRGSRKNIAYHYDLGNAFYKLWLDDSMTYSSALYLTGEESLQQAQINKYQRAIDELDVKDGDRVLEIGCGWGGFAEQLCQQKNAKIQGITLSTEQLAFARERISTAGLSDSASFSLTDYRDVKGQYDKIVSIEMLEAVGEKYWPTYFETLANRLKPGGKALIQVITIAPERFEEYRANPDFIQKYIFPGGMLPTPDICRQQANQVGLTVANELAFGKDYAKTLAEWDARFSDTWTRVEPLGFDQHFKRMWHYYLAYCGAGFKQETIDVYQFTLQKPA